MEETRVIYADVLFMINFSMDYFLLFLTARLLGKRLKKKAAAAASALGGVYAVASVLLPGNSLVALILHIAVSVLLCEMSVPGCGSLGVAVFYVVSFLIGGGMTAGFALFNRLTGTEYHPESGAGGGTGIPAGWLLLCAVGFGVFTLLTARRAARGRARSVRVTVECGDRTVSVTGIPDTGNFLREPLSGLPVILLPKRLLPDPPPERMRVVPFRTVNGEGILTGFLPRRCSVAGRNVDCCVAMTDGNETVVPACLIPEKEVTEKEKVKK